MTTDYQRDLLNEDVQRVAESIAVQLQKIETRVMDRGEDGLEFPDRLASFSALCGQFINPRDAVGNQEETITFPLGEFPSAPEIETRLRAHSVWQVLPASVRATANMQMAAERICTFLSSAHTALGEHLRPTRDVPDLLFWVNCGHQAGQEEVSEAVSAGTPGDFSIAFPLHSLPTRVGVERDLAQRSYWRARLAD